MCSERSLVIQKCCISTSRIVSAVGTIFVSSCVIRTHRFNLNRVMDCEIATRLRWVLMYQHGRQSRYWMRAMWHLENDAVHDA
ncbi:hypothetical protein BN2475_750021 [Paraburkholderia ribeironis]|uniref:Uncharacterized protein n=1 Tax=Paraburkholderia ribeironis TaxID=1247936 RepID=A0A1N7SJE5_9BURK|nr:hypothetical protein BN2475_750021 [Paraburkholderia ribeironis]